MVIEQLEVQACARLPIGAPAGARVGVAAIDAGRKVEVVYRVDRRGQRGFRYFCDGMGMPRRTLAMLLCPEAACPRASEVRQRWREFTGQPLPPVRSRPQSLQVRPLIEEVPVEVAGHHCTARPASFECLTPCPTGAHPPEVLRKPGWDLFEQGTWLAGGLRRDASSGHAEPVFRSPDEARQWLAAQAETATGVLQQLR